LTLIAAFGILLVEMLALLEKHMFTAVLDILDKLDITHKADSTTHSVWCR